MRHIGFFTMPGFLLSLVALLLVGGITLTSGGVLFSPGWLNAHNSSGQPVGGVQTHAALAGNCAACHPAPWESDTMSRRCQVCHSDIAPQMAAKTGVHGVLAAGQDCALCHTEHRGPGAALTISYGSQTVHPRAGFALDQHTRQPDGQPFPCEGCHPTGFTGFQQAVCADCHSRLDAALVTRHVADYGSACLGCHNGSEDFAHFDHSATPYPLDGAHAGLACRGCHGGRTQLAGLPLTCAGCHGAKNPHGAQVGQDCTQCHSPSSWSQVKFDHGATRFPLAGRHLAATCRACHADLSFPTIDTACSTCHLRDDAHAGVLGEDCAACHDATGWTGARFDHSQTKFPLSGKHVGLDCRQCHHDFTFVGATSACVDCHAKDDAHKTALGSNCAQCHSPAAWDRVTFDHAKTGYRLAGKHEGVACLKCHADRTYKGASTGCATCHLADDVHQGKLGPECQKCHTPDGWKPSTFDHKAMVFPLTGKHLQTPCLDCHADRTFVGTSTICYACHVKDDAHRTRLGQQCANCHNPAAWIPASFDHGSTHFPLTGAHTKVICLKCHADATFSGANPACNSCHAKDDRHKGQYGSDCAVCHTTTTWSGVTFDHTQVGFPLTGAHLNVQCTKCHVTGLKGTSAECAACHDQPASHNGMTKPCSNCHTTDNWNPHFGHGWSDHEGASCNDCHPHGWGFHTCGGCHNGSEGGGGGNGGKGGGD